MKRIMKVFLPSWARWLMPVLFLPMEIFLTYYSFFTKDGREEMGLLGWLAITAMMTGLTILMWLMATRRLPAYIVEVEKNGGCDNRQKGDSEQC